MKRFLAAIVVVVLTASATPAMAYVLEITTSIELASAADNERLRHALESAFDDILTNAIAFSPTVVTVQNTRIVGDRIYILLLIADADGEEVLKAISPGRAAPSDSK